MAVRRTLNPQIEVRPLVPELMQRARWGTGGSSDGGRTGERYRFRV